MAFAQVDQRQDIQVLRGIAVLLVLLFHFNVPFASAGYLGVDVFFVVSGYLMARQIARAFDDGTFTVGGFLIRRARRLLPAAFVVLAITGLTAPWVLTSVELNDFIAQFAGSLALSANFVLWSQSGYFASASELKPLLHMWSLSLEQQYYLLLPVVLVVVPRRLWLAVLLAIVMASVLFCQSMHYLEQPDDAFYLTPARLWELGLGSLGGCLRLRERSGALWGWFRLLAFAVILLVPLSGFNGAHPGWPALLVCLATLVVLLLRTQVLPRQNIFLQPLVWTGDVSYSLYLVHWPLIAFANNMWLDDSGTVLPMSWRIVIALVSFLLAFLLHRYVELPWRTNDAPFAWGSIGLISAAPLCVLAILVSAVSRQEEVAKFAAVRAQNFGLDEDCSFDAVFRERDVCKTTPQPDVLVWGDSFAMQLMPGLQKDAASGRSYLQATKLYCAPTIGVAIHRPHFPGEDCLRFNASVLRYLQKEPSIKTVLLAGNMANFFRADTVLVTDARGSRQSVRQRSTMKLVAAGFTRTLRTLEALGVNVVLVAPPPTANYDVARCAERQERALLTFGSLRSCTFVQAPVVRRQKMAQALFDDLVARYRLRVVRIGDALCAAGICDPVLDKHLAYRDFGHFSRHGSVELVKRSGLIDSITGGDTK